MKATELQKIPMAIDKIYDLINSENMQNNFKVFIPHWKYIENETILQLINDGFKVYKGDWDGMAINSTIIEW